MAMQLALDILHQLGSTFNDGRTLETLIQVFGGTAKERDAAEERLQDKRSHPGALAGARCPEGVEATGAPEPPRLIRCPSHKTTGT